MLNLSNKAEREAFVNNYRNWKNDKGEVIGVWKSIPELGLTFYKYVFNNWAKLIVTEYDYINWKNETVRTHRLCLLLAEDAPCVDASSVAMKEVCRTYTLSGCGLNTVVEYMTKNKAMLLGELQWD